MRRTIKPVLVIVGMLAGGSTGLGQGITTDATPTAENAQLETPDAPDMVLLYYGYDARGPRNWTSDQLEHYVAYHEKRGTDAQRPVDTFFDTVLWMYRRSSRGALFETARNIKPTSRPDWEECLNRLFEKDLQLNALEQAVAKVGAQLGRPIHMNVILTLPYPDVRVEDWGESLPGPTWDFRTSDENRLQAAKWYINAAMERWQEAEFKHLRLLGFYWFNEGNVNLRADADHRNDMGLMRQVARHLHTLKVDGRQLTMTWIPYSPYGKERLSVVVDLLKGGEPEERIDYLMVQPNYFFPRHKKTPEDLAKLVRATASVPCGVEIECDESLVRDEAARQRLRDYLQVVPAEHDSWTSQPAGYYQGLRAVHEMATRPELAELYDALYKFVKARKEPK